MEKQAMKAVSIRPYSLGELKHLYGISLYIIHKWLKVYEAEIGRPIGRTFNVHQVELIFEKFGVPGRKIEIC